MIKNSTEIGVAILAWINTLDYPNKTRITDILELFDGVILTEIMSKIHPKYFNPSHLIFDHNNSWAYIHKNLNYLIDSLEKYYLNVLFKPFEKNAVDILSLSKDKNLPQLINLLELILGAFIQCENREIYIGGILSLDEGYQSQLMHLIEDILQKTNSKKMPSGNLDVDTENTQKLLIKMDELESENIILLKKLQESEEEKEELYNKCVEINDILLKTQETSKALQFANEKFFLKSGAKNIEEYEDILHLKEKQIANNEIFLNETIKKYEEKILILQEDIETKKNRISQLQKIEKSLDYYKSKYEEFSKLSEKKLELEKVIQTQKTKLEDYEQIHLKQNKKNQKFKDRLSALKVKCIDIELEISKKNTENDVLKLEKNDLMKTIAKMEISINDKSQILNKINEKSIQDLNNADSLKNDLSEYLNLNGQLLVLDGNKKEVEVNEAKQMNYEEEIEYLKGENDILLQKCKALNNENELNRNLINKIENAMRNIQKEKEELLAQNKYLMNKEIVLNTNKDNMTDQNFQNDELIKQITIKENKIQEISLELEKLHQNFNKLKENLEIVLGEKNQLFNESESRKSEYKKEINKIQTEFDSYKLEYEDLITQNENEIKLLTSTLYELVLKLKALEKFAVIKKQTIDLSYKSRGLTSKH